MAPNGFRKFVSRDFGYEDKCFFIGASQEQQDFPYVLPGPVDTWGGTWSTAGWRTNQVNLLFAFKKLPTGGNYKLVIRLANYAETFLPLLKVSISGQDERIQLSAAGYDVRKQRRPTMAESPVDTAAISGQVAAATPKVIEVPIDEKVPRPGGNSIVITVTEGSWILFDQVSSLSTVRVAVQPPRQLFVRSVLPAPYELATPGQRQQPLLVNVEQVKGAPTLSVQVDGKTIFNEIVERGAYDFGALIPAVTAPTRSKYQILENGKIIQEGLVDRAPQKTQTLADYVDTRLGTAHSRWMIAPGPWMPFSMVKMSPDNQNSGWQAGYQPTYESVGTFSHIHEWTMAGLGVFATNGKLQTTIGDELRPASGYRSRIDKRTEEAPIGYYKVQLADYGIRAEVTATTRCGMERFTFPKNRDSARVLLDFHIPSEYDYPLKKLKVN